MKAVITWFTLKDYLQPVLALERSSNYPLNATEIRLIRANLDCDGYVGLYNGILVGHIFYEKHHKYFHIISLKLNPLYNMDMIGAQFIEFMVEKLNPRKNYYIRIDVPDDDYNLHTLLRDNGFFGKVRNSNTYRFLYKLPEHASTTNDRICVQL